MTPASKSGTGAASKKTPTGIPELIAALASPSPVARRKVREALVALGKPAVPSLIQLLSHRKPHVRWEAAKALGGIADPIVASALVGALKDCDGDVRWLAAEGLAALGQDALQPLLAALIEQNESDWLCEGAHHICHVLVRKRARPSPAAFAGGTGTIRAGGRRSGGRLHRTITIARLAASHCNFGGL